MAGAVHEALIMNSTSPSLLQRLRQPDQQDAWERLSELYTPLLYYWARSRGLQETDSADLVQEVFLILVQKLPDFEYDPGRSFRAWLRTITLNKLRERRRKAQPAQAIDAALAGLAGDEGTERFWEAEYQQQLVRRALELLQGEFQPTTWQAFWEHGWRGRAAAEVGAELGLSAGAVRAARLRVVCRLRQELAGLLD
jgi:RNA polymerase sigma-70 factor (ECF subfamily)